MTSNRPLALTLSAGLITAALAFIAGIVSHNPSPLMAPVAVIVFVGVALVVEYRIRPEGGRDPLPRALFTGAVAALLVLLVITPAFTAATYSLDPDSPMVSWVGTSRLVAPLVIAVCLTAVGVQRREA